jgi:protein-disulfide isomerase
MTTEPLDLTQLLLPIHGEDHVHGPESAPYTLVEYGDYEFPACGQLFEIIRDLQATLGDRLRIVYRHYPLSGLHPHAQEAAEAAEAAGAQGHFWEMHDLLFRNQNALSHKDLLGYGERLSLDMSRFRQDLKRTYEDLVRGDFRRSVQGSIWRRVVPRQRPPDGARDHDTLLEY